MAVSLKKNQRVDLTKGTGLKEAMLGLGWDINRYDGRKDFDLDLVIFMCDKNGRCIDDKHMIYYHNLEDPAKSVKHSGDNRTGAGEGDDETAFINFANIPENVEKIVITVSIYDAKERDQSFGAVDNAYIRIVNMENNEELQRYDLAEEFDIQTSVVFGEIYKSSDEWKFKAVGEGYAKELADLCIEYGIDVE
ncbi:MAG: TerD family protein [Clostridia bacterium]|nr:TerD family protein [Clostridia bacterium]